MKRLFKIALCIYFPFVILINVGCLNSFISFGHGLGDLYYLLFSVVILFSSVIIFFTNKFSSDDNVFRNSFGFFLIVIAAIVLLLKLTILRGAE